MMEYVANQPMDFSGALNIRELGGYENCYGQKLKKHKLLRADDLSNLSVAEFQKLQDYGISVCIDLRIYEEKKEADPFYKTGKLVYHAIPIQGELNFESKPENILYQLYVSIMEQEYKALYREFKIIADEEDGIIFHCTAGKDRTGLTAMFILAICDVCEEQIIADYEPSGKNIEPRTKEQLDQLIQIGVTNVPQAVFESPRQTMRMTLDYLNQRYGGPVKYLRRIGLTEQDINKIREKMLHG